MSIPNRHARLFLHIKNILIRYFSLFEVEDKIDWAKMKKKMYEDFEPETYDYLPSLYDRITSGSSSSDII